MSDARPLYLKDAGGFDLFFHNCPCGHRTIHGFYDQLRKSVLRERFKVALFLECQACKKVKVKWLRLTTSRKKRKRWIEWILLWCAVAPWLKKRWADRLGKWCLYLEMRLPI